MATKKPKLKQFEITAVIPTGQYANVQPKLIYEAENEQAAMAAAVPFLQKVSREYGSGNTTFDKEGEAVDTTVREMVQCYASGTKAWFDPVGHTYINEKGEKYTSGSVYASQFEHEFNKEMILPKSATKLGIPEEEVDLYWRSKGDISTTFGTALHQALEHYGKWKSICDIDVNKDGLSKGTGIHPTLESIVEAFFAMPGIADENAVYEPFVADPKKLRCGFIDRLVITGDKTCIIDDYKTNGDLYKKGIPANLKAPYHMLPNVPMSKYAIQLSFYASVLEAHGWTVEGLRIHHWNGKAWKTHPLRKVDIDIKQDKIDVSQIV